MGPTGQARALIRSGLPQADDSPPPCPSSAPGRGLWRGLWPPGASFPGTPTLTPAAASQRKARPAQAGAAAMFSTCSMDQAKLVFPWDSRTFLTAQNAIRAHPPETQPSTFRPQTAPPGAHRPLPSPHLQCALNHLRPTRLHRPTDSPGAHVPLLWPPLRHSASSHPATGPNTHRGFPGSICPLDTRWLTVPAVPGTVGDQSFHPGGESGGGFRGQAAQTAGVR